MLVECFPAALMVVDHPPLPACGHLIGALIARSNAGPSNTVVTGAIVAFAGAADEASVVARSLLGAELIACVVEVLLIAEGTDAVLSSSSGK